MTEKDIDMKYLTVKELLTSNPELRYESLKKLVETNGVQLDSKEIVSIKI